MAKKITLNALHHASHKAKFKFFNSATPEQIEELTVPCTGEAHANPHIDYCMCCLGIKWGRMLKPTETT